MTTDQFRDLVQQMRTAQRTFFKSAQGSSDRRKALADSQALERRIDDYLAGRPEALTLDMPDEETEETP